MCTFNPSGLKTDLTEVIDRLNFTIKGKPFKFQTPILACPKCNVMMNNPFTVLRLTGYVRLAILQMPIMDKAAEE
jgi:hypothetical protein